jgi:hypothetical protein
MAGKQVPMRAMAAVIAYVEGESMNRCDPLGIHDTWMSDGQAA